MVSFIGKAMILKSQAQLDTSLLLDPSIGIKAFAQAPSSLTPDPTSP
jgi:hypothetical protein